MCVGGGGVALGKGLRRARPARARRVCPVIRPRSRWAPSPAIKMLIGPAPPAAPRPGPPGREQGRQARPRGGVPVPAPTSGLAGCGSAIRGRRRPAPAPRERLPRKMNMQPRPWPVPQSRPVVSAAPPARGQLAHTHIRSPPGPRCGRKRGAGQAAAQLQAQHSRHAPARTLPERPARRALPAGVRGPGVPPCTRSLRVAMGARAPPPCTRSRLGRARTLPGATPATLVLSDSGPSGGALRAWTPEPPGAGEGGDNGSSGS